MLLQQRVETATNRAGLAPEERRYQPHVTLATLQRAASERLCLLPRCT